jgi:hypothetical protein
MGWPSHEQKLLDLAALKLEVELTEAVGRSVASCLSWAADCASGPTAAPSPLKALLVSRRAHPPSCASSCRSTPLRAAMAGWGSTRTRRRSWLRCCTRRRRAWCWPACGRRRAAHGPCPRPGPTRSQKPSGTGCGRRSRCPQVRQGRPGLGGGVVGVAGTSHRWRRAGGPTHSSQGTLPFPLSRPGRDTLVPPGGLHIQRAAQV